MGKKINPLWITICLFLCVSCFITGAQDVTDRFDYPMARNSALGGFHAAMADDWTVIFNNPAGFQAVGDQKHYSELTLKCTGPIFDITSLIIEGAEGDVNSLLTSDRVRDLISGMYSSVSLAGPISFAYFKNGIALGIFNWMNMSFRSLSSVVVNTKLQDSLLITGGYAFKIPLPSDRLNLDIGFNVKAFLMGEIDTTKDMFELISLFENFSELMFTQPFKFKLGIGFDVGVRFSINKLISMGLVCRDVFSPIRINSYSSLNAFQADEEPSESNRIIPADLSFGLQITPPLGRAERIIKDFKILVDYNDILDMVTHKDTTKYWLLHFGLGLEFRILDIVSLRGGFYQGLLAGGIGLDLTAFKFDISMFGTENSVDPGMQPVFNVVIGFDFSY